MWVWRYQKIRPGGSAHYPSLYGRTVVKVLTYFNAFSYCAPLLAAEYWGAPEEMKMLAQNGGFLQVFFLQFAIFASIKFNNYDQCLIYRTH